MTERRQFFKILLGFFMGMNIVSAPFFSGWRWAYAKAKKTILSKGTKRESLIDKDPKSLDTRNLEITPLKDFRTMGITDHRVDLGKWRLEITGRVETPLKLTYRELTAMPSIERPVLLICPGVFANHGRWKGISMGALLEKAGMKPGVKRAVVTGRDNGSGKEEVFPIGDLLSDKVFLAYGVNGKMLPEKHGFPLRVVAEDYYGDDWVKYVYKMTLK